MNLLHYVNVIIGFSLVMLLLSIIVSFTVQSWLIIIRSKTRAIGSGLVTILEDIGLEKNFAKQHIDRLLGDSPPLFGEKIGGIINKVSTYFLARAPSDVGREEFLLLLLRKANLDNTLATKLGFDGNVDAQSKLGELEKEILKEEVQDPKLPAQVWRTKAMQTIVPELASKIFARFDEVIERVMENVHTLGKVLSIFITIPILLFFWPVDSIELIRRLNNDQILSSSLADVAEKNLPKFMEYKKAIADCEKTENQEEKATCLKGKKNDENAFSISIVEHSTLSGLLNNDEKSMFGIFATWVFVSLGSAFWLGILNKMLGIRSELSKKLASQREHRETTQQ